MQENNKICQTKLNFNQTWGKKDSKILIEHLLPYIFIKAIPGTMVAGNFPDNMYDRLEVFMKLPNSNKKLKTDFLRRILGRHDGLQFLECTRKTFLHAISHTNMLKMQKMQTHSHWRIEVSLFYSTKRM